jgi:hypothetical protein
VAVGAADDACVAAGPVAVGAADKAGADLGPLPVFSNRSLFVYSWPVPFVWATRASAAICCFSGFSEETLSSSMQPVQSTKPRQGGFLPPSVAPQKNQPKGCILGEEGRAWIAVGVRECLVG